MDQGRNLGLVEGLTVGRTRKYLLFYGPSHPRMELIELSLFKGPNIVLNVPVDIHEWNLSNFITREQMFCCVSIIHQGAFTKKYERWQNVWLKIAEIKIGGMTVARCTVALPQ